MNMTKSNLFTTADLALATTLNLSIPLKYVDKSKGSRVEFIFDNSAELNELVEAFWQDGVRIEPKRFYQQLRILKARIHDK